MGLTTQYHKYKAGGIFSLVASSKCNVAWLEYGNQTGKYCAVGACENVIIWDIKTNEKVTVLQGDQYEVVKLCASPNNQYVAAGYMNGSIKVFDFKSGEEVVTFSGHKSAITALAFDEKGMILASGSKDTDIVLWDTVSQSGLYRLKGHKGLITSLVFMKSQNLLISASKDTFVKFWDLDSQHCFRTLLTHKTEVYSLQLAPNETRLYTGSADNEIRVFNLQNISDKAREPEVQPSTKRSKVVKEDDATSENGNQSDEEEEVERLISCKYAGSLLRHGKGRTVSLNVDKSGRTLLCHGIDRNIEAFLILNDEEKTNLKRKRASKTRKRLRAAGEDDVGCTTETQSLTVPDEHTRHEIIKLPSKISALDVLASPAASCQFAAVLSNNSLFAASVDVNDKKSEMTKQKHICRAGHRSDVRALCFSNDGSAVASASGEELKIWNRDSLKCIRTMACGYALCCSFLPGDRHVVVGTKSGTLQLFDLASSSLLEEIEGHTAALWSLCVLPDKRGIVTGSADKTVKFWQFELISDDNEEGNDSKKEIVSENRPAGKRLTLVATRVLQMSDDVLCVKVSADSRLLAVSLLDHTIKVFFVDTLKFFLSLYGHSLPALAIDISTDGTLLISGSADKNIKIWGLDFGDCHKSLFAHDDSVMGLTFTPKTHFFFSCGKDGAVKQWDADTFSHITTLKPSHHGEVWSVASSPSGMSLVTSSHDKSIRVWEKTEEVLVLEEEKEIEREMQFDKELEQEENPVVPGETTEEVGFANRKTIESVKGTERIIEAVELWRSEKDKIVKNQDELHPLLRAFNCKTPKDYLLEVLKKIKPSELEESLLVMPFDFATDLLTILELLLGEQKSLELVCKCQLFLLRVHHNQITSNQMLLPTMERLRQSSTKTVEHYKDRIGFNLTALQLLQLRLEEQQADELFTDATALFKKKEKRRKNKHKPA